MTSAADAIASAIAEVQNNRSDAANQCFSCQRKLWVSFFFDEPGHDAEQEIDPNKLSNLGKMYRSHSDKTENGIHRLYYNGLGVDFRQPDVARRKTAGQIGQETVKDTLKDTATDAAKSTALGQGKEALAELKNPKSWLGMIPGILAKIGVETLGAVRDKPAVSQIALTGIAPEDDQGRSSQLARVALQRMHREAAHA